MIVTTSNEVEGYRIESYLGLVRGIVVRSPSIAQGLMGGLKQIVGGNIETFAGQLFWLAVSLLILFLVIWRTAAPKIGGVKTDP